MDLPAVPDELPDAVEAHGEAHAAEQSAAQRQDDDDVVRVDVELEVVQHLKKGSKKRTSPFSSFFFKTNQSIETKLMRVKSLLT